MNPAQLQLHSCLAEIIRTMVECSHLWDCHALASSSSNILPHHDLSLQLCTLCRDNPSQHSLRNLIVITTQRAKAKANFIQPPTWLSQQLHQLPDILAQVLQDAPTLILHLPLQHLDLIIHTMVLRLPILILVVLSRIVLPSRISKSSA